MMKIDKNFRNDVKALCYDTLESVGFTHYRANGIDWPLYDGFHAWVGLNEGWDDEYFEINPFVGIHVVQIERLWHSLVKTKYNRGSATYAVHMGELAPNELAFRFYRTTDLRSESLRLAELYRDVGLSCAKKIAKYDALLPLLEKRVDMLGAYPERVCCCLHLMGRDEEARSFAESFGLKEPEYFEQFSEAFIVMLDESSSADVPKTSRIGW